MTELINDLLTNKYTRIFHEDDCNFNAPHHFTVVSTVPDETGGPLGMKEIGQIDFQEGPIKEFGVNGVANEDVLNMVLVRLKGFQNSPFMCRENAMAITKIEEALIWLRKRTIGRENRGVEGTNAV